MAGPKLQFSATVHHQENTIVYISVAQEKGQNSDVKAWDLSLKGCDLKIITSQRIAKPGVSFLDPKTSMVSLTRISC